MTCEFVCVMAVVLVLHCLTSNLLKSSIKPALGLVAQRLPTDLAQVEATLQGRQSTSIAASSMQATGSALGGTAPLARGLIVLKILLALRCQISDSYRPFLLVTIRAGCHPAGQSQHPNQYRAQLSTSLTSPLACRS